MKKTRDDGFYSERNGKINHNDGLFEPDDNLYNNPGESEGQTFYRSFSSGQTKVKTSKNVKNRVKTKILEKNAL